MYYNVCNFVKFNKSIFVQITLTLKKESVAPTKGFQVVALNCFMDLHVYYPFGIDLKLLLCLSEYFLASSLYLQNTITKVI